MGNGTVIRYRRGAMAALAGMLIAGCQSGPPEVAQRPVPEPPPIPAPAPPPPEPASPLAGIRVPASKPAPPPTEEQLRAVGAIPTERPLSARSVIGLEFDEVRRLLGEPTLRLEEPPAQVWQYQSADCTLRLVFFPEIRTQRYRSLAVQLRNSDEETDDAKSRCLNAIRSVAQPS